MGSIKAFFRRHSRKKTTPTTTSSGSTTPSSPSSTPPQHHHRQPHPSDELSLVFRKFDHNGDGKISSSELFAMFESLGHPPTESELQSMMAAADSDGDGFISFEEFVELNTSGVDPADALEDIRSAFSVFDVDRNGSISAEELARVLRSIGEGASIAQCRRMIGGVDQDGDGLISFEEFKDMMMNNGGGSSLLAAAAASAEKF